MIPVNSLHKEKIWESGELGEAFQIINVTIYLFFSIQLTRQGTIVSVSSPALPMISLPSLMIRQLSIVSSFPNDGNSFFWSSCPMAFMSDLETFSVFIFFIALIINFNKFNFIYFFEVRIDDSYSRMTSSSF